MSSQYFGNKNDNKTTNKTKGRLKKKQPKAASNMIKKAGRGK